MNRYYRKLLQSLFDQSMANLEAMSEKLSRGENIDEEVRKETALDSKCRETVNGMMQRRGGKK